MSTATETKLRYCKRQEAEIKNRIVRDLAEHVITEVRRDGLHGHWRCGKPETSNLSFSIITWPGFLCYTGDMGHYLFRRTENMIGFMQSASMSYSYAAEKCIAHDGRLREWRHELFEEELEDYLRDLRESCVSEKRLAEVVEKQDQIRREYSIYEAEHDASKAMYESGLYDGSDMPNCKAFTFHFLWGLHAIKWFCDRMIPVG